MVSKPHIAIICSRLDLPGGIERAIVNTANLFCSKQHKVSLIILDETTRSFYPLNESISIVNANLHFGLTPKGNVLSRKLTFFNHIKIFRSIIKNVAPDIIIATEYVFTIAAKLAAKKLSTKIFSWEHHHFYWLEKSRFWDFLFYRIYPKIDTVICLNKNEKEYFDDIGCRTVTIPNFINQSNQTSFLNSKTLLTIGWLIKRKGVDFIPTTAEAVFKKYADWKWKIIGSGEEYDFLVEEIDSKVLSSNIEIVKPSTHDLSSEYANASIYVMTSRFECFPMVLLEAMSYGVPCISFNCPTGPSDIINHEVDGLLVENGNVSKMAQAISELIVNEEKRLVLGKRAQQNIQRFSEDEIYKKWESLFTAQH